MFKVSTTPGIVCTLNLTAKSAKKKQYKIFEMLFDPGLLRRVWGQSAQYVCEVHLLLLHEQRSILP